jgi:hypothetical protein
MLSVVLVLCLYVFVGLKASYGYQQRSISGSVDLWYEGGEEGGGGEVEGKARLYRVARRRCCLRTMEANGAVIHRVNRVNKHSER